MNNRLTRLKGGYTYYMKWTKDHLKTYIETKEFVDTLLIPLIRLDLKNDKQLENSGLEREYLDILSYEIERRLAGRIMLLPAYTYIDRALYNNEAKRLNKWIQRFKEDSFKGTFILTLDHEWSKHSHEIDGQVLWLSHVPFDHIMDEAAKPFVQTQADKLSETIQGFWS